MKLSKEKIERIKEVLIEAQEKIDELLDYPLANEDNCPLSSQDRVSSSADAFEEVESGLYDIVKALKTRHSEAAQEYFEKL